MPFSYTLGDAIAIADEPARRHLKVSVVGIPKTMDNDLLFVVHSFGFETAVKQASEAVTAAHAEAHTCAIPSTPTSRRGASMSTSSTSIQVI